MFLSVWGAGMLLDVMYVCHIDIILGYVCLDLVFRLLVKQMPEEQLRH